VSDTRPVSSATTRPRRIFHSPRDSRRLQETLSYKHNGRLLELGFGGGGFLSLAADYFHTLGIDHSERVLSRIRPFLSSRISVRQADIEEEQLGRDHFDVVAAFNILEHLHRPDRTVQKINMVLRETGILIGSVPNNQWLLGRISTILSNIGDRTHISTYPPDQWRRIFQGAGFREIVFFGEFLFTKYLALYVSDPLWRYYAYNLVFVCRK
jgi:SAM-dependent methyltransferase